jgi:predicted  nucleic acid-binding Zn-ribbon protein
MPTNVTIVEGGIDVARFDTVETVETKTDELRIEKRVARTDANRAIVNLKAEAGVEDVVGAWFVERLPGIDVDEVDAHEDVDPGQWSFTDEDRLRFEVVVESDQSTSVGYIVTGIENAEPLLAPPGVEEIQTVGHAEPGSADDTTSDIVDQRPATGDWNTERRDSIASKVREALSDPADSSGAREGNAEAQTSGRDNLEFEFDRGDDSGPESDDETGSGADVSDSEDEFSLDRSSGRDEDRTADETGSATAAAAEDGGARETDGGNESGDETLLRGSSASNVEGSESPDRTVAPEEVPSVFVNQLRSGAVSDDEIEALREALGIQARRSTEARIEHVESRLTEFDAYVEALEAFIDENGTADEAIADLEATVDELNDRIASLENELEDVREQQATMRETVDDHDDELSAVEERTDALETRIEDLDSTTADQDSRIEDLEEDQRELRSELEDDRRDLRSDLETSIDEVESDVDDLSTRIDSIESSWRKVKDAFGGD